MLQLKSGVRLHKLQPQMLVALTVMVECYEEMGFPCIVTSANDGQHKEGSKHYIGCALDFRIKHLFRPAVQAAMIVERAKARLGLDFDILFEGDHIHVEWDAKTA